MCRAMPFSTRGLERKHFLYRWYCCGKKNKSVKIEIWFIAVCTLIDNKYASLLFSQPYFSYFSVCWAILQKFLKRKSDAYKSLICSMQRLHFQVPVGVFNCQQILAKICLLIFDIVIEKQIECSLAWHWWNSTDLGLTDMVLINLKRHKPNLENTSKYGFSSDLYR